MKTGRWVIFLATCIALAERGWLPDDRRQVNDGQSARQVEALQQQRNFRSRFRRS